MGPEHVAAVTGANKGIGLGVVRQLALRYAASPIGTTNPGSFVIYLTSRDKARGEKALGEIQGDPELKHAKALVQHGGPVQIKHHILDVDDNASIDTFVGMLRDTRGERGVDIIINNAGVAYDGFNADLVRRTLKTNYHQTIAATRKWIPVMKNKDTSRIVNLASATGRLDFYSTGLRDRFRSARETGVGEVDKLMQEFATKVAEGNHEEAGWPSGRAYAVSKAGVIAGTGALAREARADGFEGLINCCCPGWVKTDLTKFRGFKGPDGGAALPVKLALEDIGGITGEFWQKDAVDEDW